VNVDLPSRHRIVVGNELAETLRGADRGPIPPAGVDGLDNASPVCDFAFRMRFNAHDRNLAVMRANLRALAAGKRGRASGRIDYDGRHNLFVFAIMIDLDVPDRIASCGEPERG